MGRLAAEAVEVWSHTRLLACGTLMFASSAPFAPAVVSALAALIVSFGGQTPTVALVRCECSCNCTTEKVIADSWLGLLLQQAFGWLALVIVLLRWLGSAVVSWLAKPLTLRTPDRILPPIREQTERAKARGSLPTVR